MRDIQIGCNVQLPQQHDTSQTNFFLNYFKGKEWAAAGGAALLDDKN